MLLQVISSRCIGPTPAHRRSLVRPRRNPAPAQPRAKQRRRKPGATGRNKPLRRCCSARANCPTYPRKPRMVTRPDSACLQSAGLVINCPIPTRAMSNSACVAPCSGKRCGEFARPLRIWRSMSLAMSLPKPVSNGNLTWLRIPLVIWKSGAYTSHAINRKQTEHANMN